MENFRETGGASSAAAVAAAVAAVPVVAVVVAVVAAFLVASVCLSPVVPLLLFSSQVLVPPVSLCQVSPCSVFLYSASPFLLPLSVPCDAGWGNHFRLLQKSMER